MCTRYDVTNVRVLTSRLLSSPWRSSSAIWRHIFPHLDVIDLVIQTLFKNGIFVGDVGNFERLLAHKKSTCWYLFQILFWLIIPVRLLQLLSSDFANKIGFHLKNCPQNLGSGFGSIGRAVAFVYCIEKAKIKKKRPGKGGYFRRYLCAQNPVALSFNPGHSDYIWLPEYEENLFTTYNGYLFINCLKNRSHRK